MIRRYYNWTILFCVALIFFAQPSILTGVILGIFIVLTHREEMICRAILKRNREK